MSRLHLSVQHKYHYDVWLYHGLNVLFGLATTLWLSCVVLVVVFGLPVLLSLLFTLPPINMEPDRVLDGTVFFFGVLNSHPVMLILKTFIWD